MLELLEKITDLFDNDGSAAGIAVRAAAPGGLWQDVAPKGTTSAHLTIRNPGGSVDENFSQVDETFILTFTCWNDAQSPRAAYVLRDALIACLNHALDGFVLPGGDKIVFGKMTGTGRRVEDPDAESFGIHVDFQFRVG